MSLSFILMGLFLAIVAVAGMIFNKLDDWDDRDG